MPNEAYIEAHELMLAFRAVQFNGAGLSELQTLAHYDVLIEATEDDAEDRIREIILDDCAHEAADFARKVAA